MLVAIKCKNSSSVIVLLVRLFTVMAKHSRAASKHSYPTLSLTKLKINLTDGIFFVFNFLQIS